MIFESASVCSILSLVVGLLIICLYVFKKEKYANLPPGPRGLPVFGNLLTIANASNPSKLFKEMAKEYGPVLGLKLGSRFVVILNGYDVIKEALVEKADYFSGRPLLHTMRFEERDKGLMFSAEWKARRRTVLTSMHDFGLGKKSLDERMVEEASMLVKELESLSDKLINLHSLIPIVTTNIICSIICGERFDYDDEVIQKMASCLKVILSRPEFVNTDNFLTLATYIPFLDIKSWSTKRNEHVIWFTHILQSWIKEHKETFKGNIRDLIDLFISEAAKENGSCTEESIRPIIRDLFVAGTETTSTTLLWSIAYLIIHKDVQTKCHKEIHELVGRDKLPEYSELKKLPYLNSVLNEVQRMANVVPLSVFHATSSRVELRGYTIPKNSIVIVNLESALKDEKYWGDPYTFRPERWLDNDGQLLKNQAFIPFSTGKRECLAELLAKKELFIFLSSMLQKFEFVMEEETKPPLMEKSEGRIRMAPEFMVRIKQTT